MDHLIQNLFITNICSLQAGVNLLLIMDILIIVEAWKELGFPSWIIHVRNNVKALRIVYFITFSSVQFSCSVMSDSLQPHESQHARPPCPWQTPRVYSNSCPLSWWCHPAISSSVISFSSCSQSLPASGSFPMSQLFPWGGQSTGVSASASVFPINTQGWSPLGWTGWISLKSKGLSRVFSNTIVQKHHLSGLSFLHSPTLTSIHDHWKNHSHLPTTKEDSTHGHHQMVNTKIRLIIFSAAKDGEALYSQQK